MPAILLGGSHSSAARLATGSSNATRDRRYVDRWTPIGLHIMMDGLRD